MAERFAAHLKDIHHPSVEKHWPKSLFFNSAFTELWVSQNNCRISVSNKDTSEVLPSFAKHNVLSLNANSLAMPNKQHKRMMNSSPSQLFSARRPLFFDVAVGGSLSTWSPFFKNTFFALVKQKRFFGLAMLRRSLVDRDPPIWKTWCKTIALTEYFV